MTSTAMVVSSDGGGGGAAAAPPDVGSSSANNTIQVAPPISQPTGGSAVRYNNNSSIINDGGDSNKKLPQMKCETRIHPPKDGVKYSEEEIQTLGKVFDSRDIGKAIEASDYGPSPATVRRYLKPICIVYPQQPEDRAKVDAMIESSKESRAVSADMEVDEPRSVVSRETVPEEASTSTNSTLLCMEVEESTPHPILPPESTFSPIQVGRNGSSCGCDCASKAAAPIRDEHMPSAQQAAATQNKRKHDEIDYDTTKTTSDNESDLDKLAATILQKTKQCLSDRYLYLSKKRIDSLAQAVMTKCITNISNDTFFNLTSADSKQRCRTKSCMILPEKRGCSADSDKESKQKYVRVKSKLIRDIIDKILPSTTKIDKEVKELVLQRVCDDEDIIMLKKSELMLTIQELVTLRDLADMGTNAIYRFKSGLEALRPVLRGRLLPPCIKAKLAEFESSGNLEIETVMHQLIATKDDTNRKMQPFMYLKKPHLLFEILKEKSVVDGSYQTSVSIMNENHVDKDVYTINIDKGDDKIMVSVRYVNRHEGNSSEHTHPLAVVGGNGPVCECYENEEVTIFSNKYPLRDFLHALGDDTCFILTVQLHGQAQCVMFQPKEKQPRCKKRSIDVDLLSTHALESDVEYSDTTSASGGPPEVDIPLQANKISVQLVRSGDMAVGVQFLVDTDVVYCHRFRVPLNLLGITASDISTSISQVMGFPINDGKQQLILMGIKGAMALCACPSCTAERGTFGHITGRLWKLLQERKGIQGPPCKDASSRDGDMDIVSCAVRFKKKTVDGNLIHIATALRGAKLDNASIERTPLWAIPHPKTIFDPLHMSSGVINRGTDEMRDEIREIEYGGIFMTNARRIQQEVTKLLQQLTITSPKNSNVVPLLAPLHKESKKLRSEHEKVEKKVLLHEERKKMLCEEDVNVMTEDEKIEHEKEIEKLEESIETYRASAVLAWKKVEDYSKSSNYGHYCQLSIGLSILQKALDKFLSPRSKRARGPLEHNFTNAVVFLGGGSYMLENGGFEQTNTRALDTLQNFDQVIAMCLLTYNPAHPLYTTIRKKLELWREWAKHAFALLTCLKSQKTLELEEVEILLVNFYCAWDDAFPLVSCFNKLHWLMRHTLEFIERYNLFGRLSAESHESVHTRMSKQLDAVSRMSSTQQKYETFHARSSVNLKEGILENKAIIDEKMTGKKRGKYNTSDKSKRRDEVSCVTHLFEGTITVEGKEYLLLNGGGRIPIEYKELYLYVCTGRAPDSWVVGFIESKLLSAAMIEQARIAVH